MKHHHIPNLEPLVGHPMNSVQTRPEPVFGFPDRRVPGVEYIQLTSDQTIQVGDEMRTLGGNWHTLTAQDSAVGVRAGNYTRCYVRRKL